MRGRCSLKLPAYENNMHTKVSQEQTYENLRICNILDLQYARILQSAGCTWTSLVVFRLGENTQMYTPERKEFLKLKREWFIFDPTPYCVYP